MDNVQLAEHRRSANRAETLTVTRPAETREAALGQVIDWQDLGGRGPTHFLFKGGEHGASVSIFVVDFSPGEGPPLHRHPYEEVFVVQEGHARFTAADASLDAGVGHVVVVPAGTPHRFVNAGEGRLRVTSVHPRPQVEQENLND